MTSHRTMCRICTAHCAVTVEVENDRPVAVRGDKSDVLYEGFICVKGREFANAHTYPGRLLRSQKLGRDGHHGPIATARATAEIAERLRTIIDRHGPRAVAMYTGTAWPQSATAVPLAGAWMRAIESPMSFSSGTIDQPGKPISQALHGVWLADEILMQGDGQIKALITVGGNPMLAWPDQRKTFAAMQALDFHVVIDPRMTPTARLADYVIAPKLPLEVPGVTLALEALGNRSVGWGYQQPYAQYSPPIVSTPPDSDLVEEWEFFYALAQHMDLDLKLRCEMFPFVGAPSPLVAPLDMRRKPTTEELLDIVTQDSRVPLARVREHDGGRLYDEETVRVEPRDADCDARLELADATMLSELRDVLGEGSEVHPTHGHLLISRRMPHHYNSYATDFESLRSRYGANPAFMNPDDLEALRVAKGDRLVIRSPHGEVEGVAWPDPGLRRGLVSMSHCWGDNPDVDASSAEPGANTGRLSSVEVDYDPYTGIPRMSAIPVDVAAVDGPR